MFDNEHKCLKETDFFPEANAERDQGSRSKGGIPGEVQRSLNTSANIIVRWLV